MRTLIALAAVALATTGCRESADSGNAADNAAVPAETNSAAAATAADGPLGAAVTQERARALQEQRHEGMEEIGDAMKVLGREMKADSPDLGAVRTHAGTIARLAPQVSGWFPPGSGPDAGKTEALPAIWEKPEDFAAKRENFQQAAAAFNTAAQGDDVAAIKAAFGNLGKSCKACHDLYREKE